MQREFASYLYDILHAGEKIELATQGMTRESYALDWLVQAAVERKFEVMGEALSQARRLYPTEIECLGTIQPMIDFRNFLAHEYHKIDGKLVWTIVSADLPPVMASLRKVIAELDTHE